jgi:hypothetical protein
VEAPAAEALLGPLDPPEEAGIADEPQRGLFEFFSAPLPETGAPLLATDPASVAPDLSVLAEDEAPALQDEHRQIELPLSGGLVRAELGDLKAGGGKILVKASAVGVTEKPAKGGLDETTRANLRRLEETLTWLQNEAGRLPRATPLPPVAGLPALEPMVDRANTLERTLQRTPTLPIWLQEHNAHPEPPPPREPGVFWPRAFKFLMACGIAAPVSYYFAVATSPLHKQLAEGTSVTLLETPVATPPMPTPRPTEAQQALRADAVAEPEENAPKSEPAAEPPGMPKPPPTQIAIRSGAQMLPADAPMADTPAAPAPSAPAQSAEVEPAPVQPAPSQAPALETALAEIAPPPAAGSTDGKASTPVAERPSSPAPSSAAPKAQPDTALLVERGKQFFDVGDLIAARILFLRAANAGNAAAAIAMGATYDPVVLADRGVRGVAADLDKARSWYEKAKDMGSPEGPRRLEMLANR